MKAAILACSIAFGPASEALTIEIRYELAGSAFFDQPGAKQALRAAADFYEDLINDSLGPINPAQYPGATWVPTYASPTSGATVAMAAQANLVVPADTIIVYAGSMNLGAAAARAGAGAANLAAGGGPAWWTQVYSRGEPGAVQVNAGGFSANPTDFAPWGGVIFFNSAIANWNFSTTDAGDSVKPDALSVALHELGHILGLGTYRQDCSWRTLINFSNVKFMGPLALASFGSNPQTDSVHIIPGATKSRAYGCFGVAHGSAILPLMSESLTGSSAFHVPTDLDLAMLRDIGWQLSIPERDISITKSAAASLAIPSSTGFSYEIRRSTSLASWGSPVTVLQGNGSVLSWVDPTSATRAFYRVGRVSPVAAAVAAKTVVPVEKGSAALIPPSTPSPVMCDCGGVH